VKWSATSLAFSEMLSFGEVDCSPSNMEQIVGLEHNTLKLILDDSFVEKVRGVLVCWGVLVMAG
jgi:hypothetical protein